MLLVLEKLAAQRVVPLIRCLDSEDAIATGRACARGGMTVVELSCTVPNVERAIVALAAEGLVVGLGAVPAAERIGPAVSAGASFVTSFCAPMSLIATAHEHGVLAIPGALTPSEVRACQEADADAVRLFPAAQFSPGYAHHLLAVMPEVSLMPTGGIRPSAESVSPWLVAGALAVGVESGVGTVAEIGEDQVEFRARRALQAGILVKR